MKPSAPTLRWIALAALGLWVALSAFLLVVQLLMFLWEPSGHWQGPRLAKVEVVQVSRDQDGKITGQVLVKEGEEDRAFLFSPEEALQLERERRRDLWVLDNYWANGHRPNQFILTPWRLLLEYPLPLMLLAIWGMWALRRKQVADAKAAAAAPNPHRKVWKDEFHSRAERFASKASKEE